MVDIMASVKEEKQASNVFIVAEDESKGQIKGSPMITDAKKYECRQGMSPMHKRKFMGTQDTSPSLGNRGKLARIICK